MEIFRQCHSALTESLEKITAQKEQVEESLKKFEEGELTNKNLIPQTEGLLESYDIMTVEERKKLFNGAIRCGKNPPVLPGEEKGAEQQKERRAKSKPKRSRKN